MDGSRFVLVGLIETFHMFYECDRRIVLKKCIHLVRKRGALRRTR